MGNFGIAEDSVDRVRFWPRKSIEGRFYSRLKKFRFSEVGDCLPWFFLTNDFYLRREAFHGCRHEQWLILLMEDIPNPSWDVFLPCK